MVDTSGIHAVIAAGRRRMRLQAAIEGATTASILAFAGAMVVVYFVRDGRLGTGAGLALLGACAGVIVAGAVIGALRRVPTHLVTSRIDRASNLADRLSTAWAFERSLERRDDSADAETVELMRAAVRDAVRAAPRADVAAATPFRRPADARAALAFGVVGLLVAGLVLPPRQLDPHLARAEPAAAPAGAVITLSGARLCGPEGELADADGECHDASLKVLFGEDDAALSGTVHAWTVTGVEVGVPDRAPVGMTTIRVVAGDRVSAPLAFEVLDPYDERALPEDGVALSDEDLDYTRDLLGDLERTAKRERDEHLERYVDEIETLLRQAERGELSKEQLLQELARAEERYMDGSEEDLDHSMAELKKTGQELKKQKLTRELGEALAKGDLEKAQKEMQELAEKLDNQELSDKEREQVAKALEKSADEFERREEKQKKREDDQLEAKRDEVERLKKRLKKTEDEQEKEQLSERLKKKKREVQKLEREKQRKQESAQRRTVKRLHRNMRKSAEDMRQQGEKNQRQASRRMRDVARDTGKVDQDKRKIRTQKKVASQMSDLKEALRRARQKKGGQRDMFGKNRRNQDFKKRARGGQGSREAWRPGSDKGKGKDGKQPGGQGDQPGGDSYGDGHDPDFLGDATDKAGNTADESVSGVHGRGPSVRETVLSAAQKGFANKQYEQVYTQYKDIVEEVMRTEKVPSGYKYYVKRYFQKIKPHSMD